MRALVLAIAAVLAVSGCGRGNAGGGNDRGAAIAAAADAYAEARAAGVELVSGPCIADPLEALPDWVVDVAHEPRQRVDDDPANQCASYRSGDASHFVELDPDGNLIRAR
jgi:catechol 2,3-dioxygenase-like lactoylglutathione lyase family enzyme